MIRANLPTFLVLAILMFGAILATVWWLMDWRYSGVIAGRDGIIANKESEITLLKGQRDDYKDKLSGATPDQARARIDALEARLAAIEGRRLTPKQAESLRSSLSGLANVSVQLITEGPCSDCNLYSEDFLDVFVGLPGWKVDKSMFVGSSRNARTGLGLRAVRTNELNPQTTIMAKAFSAANIPFDILEGSFGEAQVQIQINTKLTR